MQKSASSELVRRRPALSLAVAGGVAAAVLLLLTVRATTGIAEDAAILMRYARHLSLGLGYLWNPGEPPVDGATDWLGTILLGGIYALGVPLEMGPRLLGGAAHVLTVVLVIAVMRRGLGAPLLPTLISAAFVILGPARTYVEAAFLTPLFALAALLMWSCIVFAAADGRRAWAYGFALATLATTLVRPEGMAFTGLMLAGAWFVLDPATMRRFVTTTLVIFVPLFLLFVAWRWHYFGRLLPLPFLKKGGGTLHRDGLIESIRGGTVLLWWSFPLIAAGLVGGRSWRWAAALAVVVGGFLSIWVLLSSEMNYIWRFQYAVLPIVAASWWGAAEATWDAVAAVLRTVAKPSQRALSAAGLLIVSLALGWHYLRFRSSGSVDGLMTTGVLLRGLGGEERSLVTTEAGLLPLYSRWRTVDAWGLNDVRVVREGGITEQYLSAIDPDVIMFHSYYSPLSVDRPSDTTWNAMVVVLHRYASCHGYALAAAFAPELTQAHYYFVKPTWPGAGQFTRAIRAAPYAWSGTQARDLSAFEQFKPVCGEGVSPK